MTHLRVITLVVSYILLALYLATTISTIFFIVKTHDNKTKTTRIRLAMQESNPTPFLPPLICIISSCSVLVTVLLLIGVHKKIYEFIVFWLFYCVSNTIILLGPYIWELVVVTHIDVISATIHWAALVVQIFSFTIIYKYYQEVQAENPH